GSLRWRDGAPRNGAVSTVQWARSLLPSYTARHAMAIEDLPSRTYGRGEVIFRQGDGSSGQAHLVPGGNVGVRRRGDGEDRVLRTLAKGDLLGEVALFRDAPHSATAVALEETALIAIPADRLEQMVTTNPRLAIALIRQLARMAAGD